MSERSKPILLNFTLFVFVFLGTLIAYYHLYQIGFIQKSHSAFLELIYQFPDKAKNAPQIIGIVFYMLFPMSLFVSYVLARVILDKLGLWHYPSSPVQGLTICFETGPILGILGTMISLSAAMDFDISGGTQRAIQTVSFRIGQAMSSSIMGLAISLISFILLKFEEKKA